MTMEWIKGENAPKGEVYSYNYALFETLNPVYVYCEICGGNKQEGEHGLGICGRFAA